MPGPGKGFRRARNKAARMPLEFRRLAMSMLADGEDYAAISEAIAEAGCPPDRVPSRRALALYAEDPEYTQHLKRWLDLAQRSEERAILASAIAEDGIESAADMLAYEALEQMYDALRNNQEGIDPAELGRLAVAVKKAGAESERAKLKAELATLRAQLEQAADAGKRSGDPAAAMQVLDDYLRGGAK